MTDRINDDLCMFMFDDPRMQESGNTGIRGQIGVTDA
jgi:hypothetical protein